MTEPIDHWTRCGVRMRRISRLPGTPDWLFLPGGPGIGSESLAELALGAALPGTCWLVDLPGDGSNVGAPGAPADPYQLWPQVFLEAVAAVDNPVAVGHSTGGEYLSLREVAVASAPWNFSAGSLDAGRELLTRMPYNRAAVEWSDRAFDST